MRFYYEYLVGEWYWALLPCISQRDDDGASGIAANEHGLNKGIMHRSLWMSMLSPRLYIHLLAISSPHDG